VSMTSSGLKSEVLNGPERRWEALGDFSHFMSSV
jgi:hypothetical protein